MRRFFKNLGRCLESAIWASRLTLLIAVIVSIVLALSAMYVATVDAFYLLGHLPSYADPTLNAEPREHLRTQTITSIIKIVDGYLIASILFIFAFGLYEIFISRLEAAEEADSRGYRLPIRSIDDLKERIARLILLILVIEFFQYALLFTYTQPLDLLYLALGILFIGGALYLTSQAPKARESDR